MGAAYAWALKRKNNLHTIQQVNYSMNFIPNNLNGKKRRQKVLSSMS